MTTKAPAPPRHLRAPGKRLWRSVVGAWLLDKRQMEILRLACEAADRAESARLLLEEEGLTVTDRYGQQRPHPAASIESTSRSQVERLLRGLALEPSGDDPRPPRLAG